MMFNNISEKDILDVFLESDTDEEDGQITEKDVTKQNSFKFKVIIIMDFIFKSDWISTLANIVH